MSRGKKFWNIHAGVILSGTGAIEERGAVMLRPDKKPCLNDFLDLTRASNMLISTRNVRR